jgi:hypothetical protein
MQLPTSKPGLLPSAGSPPPTLTPAESRICARLEAMPCCDTNRAASGSRDRNQPQPTQTIDCRHGCLMVAVYVSRFASTMSLIVFRILLFKSSSVDPRAVGRVLDADG